MGFKSKAAMVALSTLAFSCGEDAGSGGSGKLRVILQAEATITDGIDKGTEVENTQDYDVRFSKYLITVGAVKIAKSSSDASEGLPDVYVADLKQVGEQGVELGVFEDIEAGQWDKFGFETPAASSKVRKLGNVSDADVETMGENGWTYWIEGEVLRDDADPVSFTIQTETATVFGDCELDGEPGVSVVENGTSTATITIHGDHLVFNSFPTGSEGVIKRLAGWIIEADQDMDGKVVTEDLASVDATEVFTSELGYSLKGAPIVIDNALDYVRAQLATQGHLNGEGECVWAFGGAKGD